MEGGLPVGSVGAPAARPRRASRSGANIPSEFVFERNALVWAEVADPAGLSDAKPLHGLPHSTFVNPRQGLKQGRDLHLADSVIRLVWRKSGRQGCASCLEGIPDFCSLTTGFGGFLRRGGALVGRKGRKGHRVSRSFRGVT
jgi:hypothetical protein